MKNIIVTLLILISTAAESQYLIEFQGGTNLANLTKNLNNGAAWKTRVGFVGSISTAFNILNSLDLQSGFRFIQKGTKFVNTLYTPNDVHGTITYSYLEIPVYCKYKIIDHRSRLYLLGGPTYSFLTSARVESTDPIFGNNSIDLKSDLKQYDISLDLGLCFEEPINKQLFFVASAIYSYGLVTVGITPYNEQTRDVRLALGLGYSFQ